MFMGVVTGVTSSRIGPQMDTNGHGFVVQDNVLALVAAIHDMVNRARILNA